MSALYLLKVYFYVEINVKAFIGLIWGIRSNFIPFGKHLHGKDMCLIVSSTTTPLIGQKHKKKSALPAYKRPGGRCDAVSPISIHQQVIITMPEGGIILTS